MATLSMRIGEDLWKSAKSTAQASGMTLTAWVEEAMEEKMARQVWAVAEESVLLQGVTQDRWLLEAVELKQAQEKLLRLMRAYGSPQGMPAEAVQEAKRLKAQLLP